METLFHSLYQEKLYKVEIFDRNYTKYKFYRLSKENKMDEVVLENIHPANHRLFHNDYFIININDEKIESIQIVIMEKINIRSGNHVISGVLDLKSNKTYGRHPKNGKLLYKVIPDDPSLPSFLIPYEMKHVGFSKQFINLYVTFVYTDWIDKHPHGSLLQNIGQVDNLDSFYEYRLQCKHLNHSIQRFTKEMTMAFKKCPENIFIDNILSKYASIQDRRGEYTNIKNGKNGKNVNNTIFNEVTYPSTFSIDPEGSVDFDDAFRITKTKSKTYLLSIYISNVTIWLDTLNLWEAFSERTSTIYLPDKKRTMLPTLMSDNLCSLQENMSRFAFTLDITIDANTFEILNSSYNNYVIRVEKNYCYEEESLLNNPHYIELLEITKQISQKYKYTIENDSTIHDSHDVVAYWMIFMNHHCAKDLVLYQNGIFRTAQAQEQAQEQAQDNNNVTALLPKDVSKFLQIWNTNTRGQYINIYPSFCTSQLRHDQLNLDAYIHITSPIRRIVDLLNMIKIQKNNNMIILTEKADNFYEKWTTVEKMQYINTSTTLIRKVQNECSLLEMYTNHSENLEPWYDGYVIESIEQNKKTFVSSPSTTYQYTVYLPILKMTSKITTVTKLDKYDKRKFQLYLFNDEEALRKKIRLQMA